MSWCKTCYNLGKNYKGYVRIKMDSLIVSGTIEDLGETLNQPCKNNSQCVLSIKYSLDMEQAMIEFCSEGEYNIDDLTLTGMLEKALYTRDEARQYISDNILEWNIQPIEG